ncbi:MULTISPECIES: ROK family protein [Streptomyces]|uniref:ROK family protein n=1 Tax=Streptomyces caniscabiei TaxID=2746961 RepID=A0ABU4MUR6_9ACTN|nr:MULTISPECIES: ROK family protein [Streptomyces]MBE4738169.1 ROK family protein [Streptomyces caniscabiei]MBE4756931.1 ROK family protein [Streptomyces caniscabiei]MBE4773871.1 ROK family protein [Streptomyces caniscabiei]MBE4785559.1 ROK family protein [Streptomyces caniscabiei]MBE4796901.1 ROK family protein [Streptomyces caniscabiei]
MRHVIALDVGGTGMKAALVGAGTAPSGDTPPGAPVLLHQARLATGRERGPEAVVASILDFAAELRAYGERHFGEPAVAAGVAVPGIVDAERGTAVYAANLGWRDVPLRALLTERLGGVPVALGHDVRTGGLAEGRVGAGRGADRYLFVALGTGIAGAIGVDGRVEAGAHGFAGEIGHIVVRPGGIPCPCGQYGCLERYASAAAVSQAWAEACGDPEADAADCAKAVESGDPRASAVWQHAVDALADGLVTALTLLDPRTLIIGGGLAEAGDTLFAPLRAAVEHRVTFQKVPTIVPAALGDTAGSLGAGLMAWDLITPTTPTPPTTPTDPSEVTP